MWAGPKVQAILGDPRNVAPVAVEADKDLADPVEVAAQSLEERVVGLVAAQEAARVAEAPLVAEGADVFFASK